MMTASRVLKALLAFCVWTGASLLCHQTAAMFVLTAGSGEASRILLAMALTFLQVFACYLLVAVQLPVAITSRQGLLGWCRLLGHVMATLATNLSLASTHAASALAVKMAEPITTALVQRAFLSTPLHASTVVSLPLVVAGAAIFAADVNPAAAWSQGAALAFLSNLCLAVRNTAIKLEQGQGALISPRPLRHALPALLLLALVPLASFVRTDVIGLTAASTMPGSLESVHWSTIAGGLALTSSLMHVLYSYLSAGVVLRQMSVVTHALANVGKRVLVVLLLYVMGKRTAFAWNFLGLGVSTAGLLIYTAGKLSERTASGSAQLCDALLGKCSVKFRRTFLIGVFTTVSLLLVSGLSKVTTRQPLYYETLHSAFSTHSRSVWKLPSQPILPEDENNAKPDFQALLSNPLGANATSSILHKSIDIIEEAQRLHFSLFSELFRPAKYAVFISMAAFENKGDPAISVGEMLVMRRLGLKLIYYCTVTVNCGRTEFQTAAASMRRYTDHEVVVLMQGGGNIVAYPNEDLIRSHALEAFWRFKFVLFPQSFTILPNSQHSLKFAQSTYRGKANLTMVFRDAQSYNLAVKHFSGKARLVMAPDMAFQMGPIPRTLLPAYDVVWLQRSDPEMANYSIPALPPNVTFTIGGWVTWPTARGNNHMENAMLIAHNGLTFLQRGRVVIADRLHGHILSILLDIPHVLIDNPYRKMSSYYETWTRSSEIALMADGPADAVVKALYLLDKFRDRLPPVLPFYDVKT